MWRMCEFCWPGWGLIISCSRREQEEFLEDKLELKKKKNNFPGKIIAYPLIA